MVKEFFIPKLGDGVKEATIVKWLVDDGAKVSAGDEIVELETDKAVVPVPAEDEGYLHIGPYKAGDVVSIMTVVATIGGQNEAFEPGGEQAAGKAQAASSAAQPADQATPQPDPTPTETNGRPKATPVAQKMAEAMGVDLGSIRGSGEHGKITKDDVLHASSAEKTSEAVIESAPPQPQAAREPDQSPEPRPEVPSSPVPADDVAERIPLKGIRGVIARRMAESVHTTARVTLTTDVDVTELVALREDLKAKYTEQWGFAPGYNDLLALITATGLREFPTMNARLSADGEAIERLKPVNMGMAVDTDRGLLVVVIRDADKKGLQQFGAEFRNMVNRAREGKSKPDDLSGGTFTITSLGIYRVEAFTPVINLPEAAILGIGRIMPKPVVKNNEIAIRKMMTLSLVFDHRLTDGAPAARFLDTICDLIEDPSLLFLARR